jgi:SAM-dependent methyltransferase
MEEVSAKINVSYENFWSRRSSNRVYPTEFVVRAFLANYPGLNFPKPKAGDCVLDVAFGDGRNTSFLCDQGFQVSGIEITQGIVDCTRERLEALGHHPDLRVGRNSNIPFDIGYFDSVLASHCCYYCDEGETFQDNMREYARIIKPGGWLVASIADTNSYIFDSATRLEDGSFRIAKDPYQNRLGYRLHGFSTRREIESCLSHWYTNFSFGHAANDFFGVDERLHWVVCQKK